MRVEVTGRVGMTAAARRRLRTRGCRLFVAAAGYGKTTVLEAAYADGPTAVHSAPDLVADPSALTVNSAGERAAHVVVDDVGALDSPALGRLARTLGAVPDDVPLSLASRRPLDPAALSALPAPVTERTAADLGMPADAVAEVLADEYGVADVSLAYQVAELTAGWPALVTFAGEALRHRAVGYRDLLRALTGPGTPAAIWLREEVLATLPPSVDALLGALVDLEPITVPLCAHLAGTGALGPPGRALPGLRWLIHTGLVVVDQRSTRGHADLAYRVVPLLAALLAGPAGGERDLAAAGWYQEHGYPLAAARALRRAGELHRCVALIESAGDEIVAAEGARAAGLIEAVPAADRSARLRLLLGDALRIGGDVRGALHTFEPLLADAQRLGYWSPGLVWRAAMAHYMRSDYRAALAVCDRWTGPGNGPHTVDDALVMSCRATTLARLGDPAATAAAADALRAAQAVGSDRALAAAHLAVAFTEVGGRRDRHLADALAAAERAGDLALLTRVLLNQAEGLLREARYGRALDVASRAVRAAEAGGPPGMQTVALCNAGDALTRLGRYDEAALHFDRAVHISRRVGLNRIAMGLVGLGELHRLRGHPERSRAALEEAVDLARAGDDRQVLVPALTRLARVLLEAPDVAAARAAAAEAERLAPPVFAPQAMVARGWVALAEGDLDTARQRAEEAVRTARASRRIDALAESLELAAAVGTDVARARAALREAEAIWRAGDAAPAADQVVVLLGRLPDADGEQRSAAKAAEERLRVLGVRAVGGSPAHPAEGTGPVRIQVLGRFEVLVAGRPVPLTAWRSRQARSLLKILVARRGRPVPRAELCELLWPDDEPRRTAHRLSVLLSVIRTVLDPARLWPVDHHVQADNVGISLDFAHVTVDAEELLRDAGLAARLGRAGEPERAREVLAEVDARYHGDAFDDEPYADWAQGLREEVRAAWLRGLRQLATLGSRAGDLDQAVASLVRLCGADEFDESAHQMLVTVLVRAGRHGEARRAFDRWARAMRTIDAPPPDRALLHQ
jgi:DNA-binding SARP family transcriptional activator/ATP/maltotriose-dependent transcriptional regulator MalT